MIRKMSGNRRDWSHPVLVEDGVTTVMDSEKAEMMANTFIRVHSSNNLSEEGKTGRDVTKAEYRGVLTREVSLGWMRMLLLL